MTTTCLSWRSQGRGLLTQTISTTTRFMGQIGQEYYFQIRATDNVSNTGSWVEAGPVTINAVTKYYTHGGSRVAMRQGDEVYYLHGDHLGSTSLTTDSSGVKVSEVRYLPYGEERWTNEVASPADFGFTSQRAEKGFGLYDYKARYYSPVLGRFVSPDTIVPELSNSQHFNRYSYVNNNPVKYIDPSGNCIPENCPWVPQAEIGLTQELYDAYGASQGVERFFYAEAVKIGAARDRAGTGGMPWLSGVESGVAFDQTMILMKEGPLDELMYEEMIQTTAVLGGHLANGFGASMASGGVAVLADMIFSHRRASQLQELLPGGSKGRVTIAAGVAEAPDGTRQVLIGTSEGSGYLRSGVREAIRPGEIVVSGTGHAEANIVNYTNDNGLRVTAVGAGRPICEHCEATIVGSGGIPASPTRSGNNYYELILGQ